MPKPVRLGAVISMESMLHTQASQAESVALPALASKTDQLFETLGQAIVSDQFDTRIFTSELIVERHYQVSRSVAREAVRMLRAKGLLSSSTRQGICLEPMSRWNLLDPDVLRWIAARPFSPDIFEELMQLRLAVEPRAAGLAAEKGGDGVRVLHLRLAAMQRHWNDADGLCAAQIAFHAEIIDSCGNRFLKIFKTLAALAIDWRWGTSRVPNLDLKAYRKLVDAMERGEAVLAEAGLKDIIARQRVG